MITIVELNPVQSQVNLQSDPRNHDHGLCSEYQQHQCLEREFKSDQMCVNIIKLGQLLLIRRQQIRIMEICRQSIKQLQKPALHQQP